MFVDRKRELDFLNGILQRQRPGPGQLILLYGRRRVGKTALLRHWAGQSGFPFTYWVADKEAAPLQRRSLFAKVMEMPEEQAASFDSWPTLWQWLAPRLTERGRHILILDEFPYASDNDPALLSALQHAWDQHLKESETIVALCGSHVNTMETLMQQQSPLFGRLTGQWYLKPLPFSALSAFFPTWSAEERVALYAIAGGVPAYLEWLDPDLSLVDNIREVILAPGAMFMAEPQMLLYDELRDPETYLCILRAIAKGHHTPKAIGNDCLLASNKLGYYLGQLQTLRLVERRLPATLTPAGRRRSKKGRYHLRDSYFRFYFRFLAPSQRSLLRREETMAHIKNQLRSFVGLAFERLARHWVTARPDALPFRPESIGSHWGRGVQIDVTAVNWEEKAILLGECKWGAGQVGRKTIREMIERKGPRLRREMGEEWAFHYAFFARQGFTEAAATTARAHDALLLDLNQIDADLRQHSVG